MPGKLGFGVGEIPEPLLPLGLETASYETVLGLDRFELSLGTFSFIARAQPVLATASGQRRGRLRGSPLAKGQPRYPRERWHEENLGHCIIDPSATYTHDVVSQSFGPDKDRFEAGGR